MGGDPMQVGWRLRKVLRCLVTHGGQAVSDRTLVRICGRNEDPEEGKAYEAETRKVAERWIGALREAPHDQLKNLLPRKQGGFCYGGPVSFCVLDYLPDK